MNTLSTNQKRLYSQTMAEYGADAGPKNRFDNWLIIRWLAIGLLTVTLGLGLYKGARIGLLGWQLFTQTEGLMAQANAGLSAENIETLQPELVEMASQITALESELAFASPLLNRMDGVTVYGSTLAAVPELLAAGSELSQMAADGLTMLTPILAEEQPSVVLATMLQQNPEAFSGMTAQAERSQRLLMSIDPNGLHPALAGPVADLQSTLNVAVPALRTAPAIPTLLGMDGAVRFLLLMQNNHELRGTGGLISAVGELTVENAELGDLILKDSYDIFDPTIEHPPAPEPLQKYMGIEIMTMRDANWSPDLPTSARTVRQLYFLNEGVMLDGVVTVDLRAVELVIDGLGGVQLEGVDQIITGANVVEIIQELWGNPLGADGAGIDDGNWKEWYGQRKDFIPNLADAILQRLTSGEASMLRVALSGQRALAERSIQVWFDQTEVVEELTSQGWSGSLLNPVTNDYLALVDTNVGYNKVNAVIEREINYNVTWPDGADAAALAVAQVTYRHPIEKPNHVCDLSPRYGSSYQEMFERCYFNYVRLYVPRGSELIDINGVDPESIASNRGERRTQVFSGYMILQPGEQRTVTFSYRLPPTITQDAYELVTQRQAGTTPLLFTFTSESGTSQSTVIQQNTEILALE